MDRLENHIITLEEKIDRLCTVVEKLNHRLDESLPKEQRESDQQTSQTWETHADVLEDDLEKAEAAISEAYPASHHRGFSALMEHKDILMDDDNHPLSRTASDGEEVSPEIQIRRLNTQLTAAYNRIAALEEQLLAQRIHF